MEYFSANLEQKALDLVNLTGLVGWVEHPKCHVIGLNPNNSQVCMTPDGFICVVDFGNTRVQLF